MSAQQPRRPSRSERTHPQSLRQDSPKLQPSNQQAIPSIETGDAQTQIQTSQFTPKPSPSQAANSLFRVPVSPRSAAPDSQRGAKIAIPRLKRSIDATTDPSTHPGRHRVNHACEPCRHRKTKCSGERPVCRHCQDFKITCFYADGKRDRVKKQFGSMTEKVTDYEKLLRELLPRVNDSDAKLIRVSLEKETQYDVDDTVADASTVSTADMDNMDEESGEESEASAAAGSTGALDRTEEDFTRDQAKATGFMGKNSEITWLQRLRRENKYDGESNQPEPGKVPGQKRLNSGMRVRGSPIPLPEGDKGFTIQDSSYHLDDFPVTTFEAVDPYEMPTPATAQHLFRAYMSRVHPTFPVVGKINLSAQFAKFISGQVQHPPDKWLAIVNMIFAIGAKYSHFIRAEWKGDERDHLIYFTRARLLSVNAETMFQHADLQQIQILGLMSFYFLCTSQINRAWTLVGIAVRSATGLGMNMRNESTKLRDSLKEIRYRVWWALYSLEHRLCSMTGRVNCILDDHCTTPLPIPLEEEQFESEEGLKLLNKERQREDRLPAYNSHSPSVASSTPSTERSRSQTKADKSRSPSTNHTMSELEWAKDVPPNASLFFLHLVQLSRLTQNIFQELYNPSKVVGTWSGVQGVINDLDAQLENWYRKLPSVFDFRRNQRDRELYEYRMNLGFFYYGTKMIIHRPCLCRLDRKMPSQSAKSQEFNRNSAAACVEAAQDVLRLLPDEPNAIGLISVGPWWSILQWPVQAATVLLLEISFRAHHMPEEAENILEASKKAIRWLHALGEDNIAAVRAWKLCNSMLHEAVSKIGREVKDLPVNPPGRSNAFGSGDTTGTNVSGSSTSSSDTYRAMNVAVSNYAMTTNQPLFQMYSAYDQHMQYDQMFPIDQAMNSEMRYQQPTDAEMEFMSSAYHDDPSPQDGITGHGHHFN